MKILYVTTISGTLGFFKEFIGELIRDGHTVDVACNDSKNVVNPIITDYGCKVFSLSCTRSPLNKATLKTIRQIRDIVSSNGYDVVHCHTPIAAMCTRIACRKLRTNGVKVIYTAHGFHFYKGAPKKNWIVYYPIEKMCSRWTDVLITINQEDYEFARRKLKANRILYVPGVGIDISNISKKEVDKEEKRRDLGVPQNSTLLLSVGELNENKNHEIVIRAIAEIDNDNIYYVIAGRGNRHDYLLNLISELGLESRVKLLGYRTDVLEVYKAADVFIHPSFREGLPVSVMEAMVCGLPVIASSIRGNVDLIDNNGGKLFNPYSIQDCRIAIQETIDSELVEMGEYNKIKAQSFGVDRINNIMKNIYESL